MKNLLLILVILLIPVSLYAGDATVTWTHTGECDGYRIYDQDKTLVLETTNKTAIIPDVEDGDAYFVRAFKGDVESDISNVETVVGDKPNAPLQFIITVEQVQ